MASSQSLMYAPLRPLIVLIGDEKIHETIMEYLEHQSPPLASVLTVRSPATLLALQAKTDAPAPLRTGILPADWLAKHRTRRPAVALVLIPRGLANGDPTDWSTVAAQLDAVHAASQPRSMRVVVAVVHPLDDTPLDADRREMIARHAGAERSCVVPWAHGSGEVGLQSLAVLLHAQAAAYYAADAQRRLNKYATGGLTSVDLNLRAAFKVAALAEQQGQWEDAARLYGEAYSYVPQVSMAGAAPLQRFLEVRAVAELVHTRMLAMLLRDLKTSGAAAERLSLHLSMLRAVPLQPTSHGIAANHAGWMARQLQTAGMLVATSGLPPSELPPQLRPAQLFLDAAQAAGARRAAAEASRRLSQGEAAKALPLGTALQPGAYVGQFAVGKNASPSDSEVESLLEAEETACGHGNDRLHLLMEAKGAAVQAHEHDPSGRHRRLLCRVNAALGEEQLLHSRNIIGAREALSEAAQGYRDDRWEGLLWGVLLALRSCAAQEGDRAAHVALSLEAAACSGAAADLAQRRAIAESAVEELLSEEPRISAVYACPSPDPTWLGVLRATAGFASPKGGGLFSVAILNAAPVDIPICSASVSFDGPSGSVEVGVAAAVLPPALGANSWTKFEVDLAGRAGGWLAARRLALHLTPSVTLEYALPEALSALPIKPPGEAPPWAATPIPSGAQWGLIRADLPPRNSPPTLSITAPDVALAGECVEVFIEVAAGIDAGLQAGKLTVEAGGRGQLASRIHGEAAQSRVELSVPGLGSGAMHRCCVSVVADSRAGEIVLAVKLQYTCAAASDDGGLDKERMEEESLATASCQLPVALPFDIDVEVTGPAGEACMLPSTPPMISAMASLSINENGLGPKLPERFFLPARQPCTAAVAVRSLARVPLHILGVEWQASQEGGGWNATPLDHTAGAAAPIGVLEREGATCVTGFALECLPPGALPSVGTLAVRWQRADPALKGGKPAEPAVALLRMPGAVLSPPSVAVLPTFPHHSVMGQPMSLQLLLSSHQDVAEVEVGVGEPRGWMVAGPKATTVTLTAGQPSQVSFCLVPYHVGHLQLPEFKVMLGKGGGEMRACEGCVVFVKPGLAAA